MFNIPYFSYVNCEQRFARILMKNSGLSEILNLDLLRTLLNKLCLSIGLVGLWRTSQLINVTAIVPVFTNGLLGHLKPSWCQLRVWFESKLTNVSKILKFKNLMYVSFIFNYNGLAFESYLCHWQRCYSRLFFSLWGNLLLSTFSIVNFAILLDFLCKDSSIYIISSCVS